VARTRKLSGYRIFGRVRAIAPRTWLLVLVPFSIFIAMVLRVGPDLQRYAFSTIDSRAPTIYAAAFQNGIPEFPSLGSWIGTDALSLLIVIISVGVTCAVFTGGSLRSAAVRAGIATFVLWTISDTILFLIGADVSILPSLVANFFGGFLMAVIVFPVLCLYEFLRLEAGKARSSMILFPVFVIGLGFFISAAAYYTILFMYRPLPIALEATFSAPASGSFLGREFGETLRNDGDERATPGKFGLLPAKSPARAAEITNVNEPFRISWKSGAKGETYDVEVSFFADCANPRRVLSVVNHRKVYTKENVNEISIQLDKGLDHLFVLRGSQNKFSVDNGRLALFSLDRDSDADGTEHNITSFVGGDGVLEVDSELPLSFFVAAPLSRTDGGKVRNIPRTIIIALGPERHKITFARNVEWNPGRRMHCEPFSPGTGSGLTRHINTQGATIGALITISRKPEASYAHYGGQLRVASIDGWVRVVGIDYQRMGTRSLGTTGSILFGGNVSRLLVDNRLVQTSPENTISALGEFHGSVLASGGRHISGVGRAIWNDQSRLNPTRWETLGTEWQIFVVTILGGLLTTCGALLRRTFGRLLRDEPLHIYS
jgi:hypothetical protein